MYKSAKITFFAALISRFVMYLEKIAVDPFFGGSKSKRGSVGKNLNLFIFVWSITRSQTCPHIGLLNMAKRWSKRGT